MASQRDIKKRIKGVKNIQQITRTMEMVAAAKLRRSQIAAQNARPYAEKINELVHNIGEAVGKIQHPLLKVRPTRKVALLVVTSNKGLCGAFNGNIFRKVEDYLKENEKREYLFFCVGKKARDYFFRKEHNIIKSYIPSEKEIEQSLVDEVSGDLMRGYEEGDYDEVVILFSKFISTMIQKPNSLPILPFTRPSKEEKDDQAKKVEHAGNIHDYLFEPEPEELMAELIPKYIKSQVYDALAETQAGEQAARLIAMKNATDNAKEMIKNLTLSYNKARQAGITKEILEIVSGAEAIKDG